MNKTETPSDTFSELHSTIAIGLSPALVGLLLGIYSLCYFVVPALKYQNTSNQPPIVGYRSLWEPTWLVRLRFIRGSRKIIGEGYERFKDSMFKVRRVGTDVLLVSSKYMDDIRTLTRDATGSVPPLVQDYPGEYTHGMPFLRSDLQNRVLQQKLTPNLPSLVPVMVEELEFAMKMEMPECADDWTTVDIMPILSRIITRITSRIFLGPKEGRNEEWLVATVEYTKNLFLTGMALRFFPRFLRPLVAPLLPSYHHLWQNVATSRRIVGEIVRERREIEAAKPADYTKPADILQWMMDAATGQEAEPEDLAQRMLILSVTSIHTTTLTMTQAIYDLCAHPQYLEPLRAEVVDVLCTDGGWGKLTVNHLRKMDSLLKESQRFNPVFLLTFNRILPKSITLSNGVSIPVGSRIAVPSNAMLNDPSRVPGNAPTSFDAFRYSRLREEPENAQRHLFVMTDHNNLAFGYGKFACPGRFYAANEMKMMLALMLICYDIRFPDGCRRPRNFTIDSDMYPDPATRLLIRKRPSVEKGMEELLTSVAPVGA
ncbi:cytochrome P450 [Aspergillus welwitschiae]|uniref:Cytochrome P450 n=1 Tax=Aspergillus welwitschiae TaxID=1341132 RepID=A0A3F3PWL2_9EURO|nr:cytochrome P450 [Aspergillus welwitschiae]RDH31307.1 cytochrome P450 [Aspergillus welwitschiae]